jgi:hypothetical protein
MLANKHGLLHGVRASTKKLVFATIGFQTQRELGISNSTSVEREKSFSMVQHKTHDRLISEKVFATFNS